MLCDTGVLKALPNDLLRDGAAEIIKYGVLSAPDLFERMARGSWLETMDETVERCVRIKRDIVAEDERDTGNRQLLNLGHTLGHAVEACSNYTLSHRPIGGYRPFDDGTRLQAHGHGRIRIGRGGGGRA